MKTVLTSTGELIAARTYVLATGTFLRGVIHQGEQRINAGRYLRDSNQVEPPSVALADTLRRLQYPIGRLTTGTPPRLAYDSINYSGL